MIDKLTNVLAATLAPLQLENWVFESDKPDAELKLIDFGLSTYFGKVSHHPASAMSCDTEQFCCVLHLSLEILQPGHYYKRPLVERWRRIFGKHLAIHVQEPTYFECFSASTQYTRLNTRSQYACRKWPMVACVGRCAY